ncbi:hypothetical protein ES705_29419 [subsurface metagenome]
MSKQLHKIFTDNQVKSLIKSYLNQEIKMKYVLQMLQIKRSRFFELLAKYRKDPDGFSIQYERSTINRKINPDIENNILKELQVEKYLIKNKDVPVKYYNYSYIKDLLEQKYDQRVSLPTIIDRAKRNNFYFLRPKRETHDKEVSTNYPGELIQHDSSCHRFAPYATGKWYLITSLDDYSRLILYAVLVEKETT